MQPVLLTAQGEPVPLVDGGFSLEEAREYVLRVSGAGEVTAWLGALQLEPAADGAFGLRIDHAVGANVLAVRGGGKALSWPIRIRPRADKLTDDLWLAMVTEIEAWLPGASVGTTGAKHGEVGNRGVSLPLLVEALAPLIPALEGAVWALLRRPRERVRSHLEDVPLRMTRQVDRESLIWLGRHPDVARWLRPWDAVELDGPPPTVPQRMTVDTVDHPANRYVSSLLVRVVARLDDAVAALRRLAAGPDAETARWCAARADRLEVGARRLDAQWRRSFLRTLPREPASEAALLVVLDDPVYAQVHKLGRRFLSPLFRLDGAEGAPAAAVVPSFTMYELWCLLAVGRQLRDLLPEAAGWRWAWRELRRLLETGSGSGARLVGEHAVHGRVELLFNPVFTGFLARSGQQRWSLSGQRRPDLVVNWRPAEGEGSWVVLDAKYRAGRDNLAQAFESVHIYRDALRFEGLGGRCRAACLLAPAWSPDTEPWFAEDFRSAHGCGIWALRPGVVEPPSLGRWVLGMLTSQ